ncbi:MAG: hypothetical protein IIX01_01495 [Clostridia bacterium]|nr:hypothetical protein [Clostridia bacterium]
MFFMLLITPSARLLAIADNSLYGSYAYVPTESVYFYSDSPDESKRKGVFLLPCTYYVRILSAEQNYYRVEYLSDGATTKKITGYCKKDEIIPVDYIPDLPYLYLTVNVTYRLEESSKQDSFSTITIPCIYYGDYKDGTQTYCYVLRNGSFGYVPKPYDLSFEPNTEYADRHQSTQTPSENSSAKEEKNSLTAPQIVMLVLLCLLIPTVGAIIVRPGKKQPYDGE